MSEEAEPDPEDIPSQALSLHGNTFALRKVGKATMSSHIEPQNPEVDPGVMAVPTNTTNTAA